VNEVLGLGWRTRGLSFERTSASWNNGRKGSLVVH
jgi:hypothetical protein